MPRKKSPKQLRSHRWFGPNDLRSFGHRSRARQMGYASDDFQGKLVIAIINTWSVNQDLIVNEDSVLVLQNAGPLGGPGMPEWGMLPLPEKLLKKGVRDMVRISDARMSGTAYGTCVLHVSPESYVGGPLALVQDGDMIELDIPGRRLDLL